MKLGVICESNVNAYYRAIFPARALQRRGHTVAWPIDNKDVPMTTLLDCDLVHCYRRMDRLSDLRTLARYGVAIGFDNDDNYAAAEVSHVGTGLEGRRVNNRLARLALEAAKLSDLMTTTSVPLADHYRSAGVENVTVIGNHLERDIPGFASRAAHDGVVLGWVAEIEHRTDLERLSFAATIRQLLETIPDLRVLTIGLRLAIQSDRYEYLGNVPFLDLLKTISVFDVGVAPLVDTEFNRSRSDIKLKEYSSAGAAWLASPVGPYLDLGEAQGGMLVADDEWIAKTTELIRNTRKRRRLTKRAIRWAKQQTMDRHAHLWEEEFARTIERVRNRGRAG